ncbi:transglutaminase-like domain-containing protein [Histidinibacterium lentulum]|uniref:Transglutaminase family protein n=1 Tax=Histidinibacterium lentulum TaxID=2480588 RepID=A0A3N2R6H2_9RHOB|nr:transglutaminase family protein [Histidinibacterium lentulum]ROU03034.1 transglutaminase family protein [Histidinibacterium lentulum]
MRLSIDVTLSYQIGRSRAAMLAIEAARYGGQTVVSDDVSIDRAGLVRIDGESGIGTRIWAWPETEDLSLRYRAEVEVTRRRALPDCREATAMHDLPAEALTYLRPSRFCPSDAFTAFVRKRFGGLDGTAKVVAIRDWVAREISYLQATSDAQTTALDTFARREGVCRDFAHMVCALSRASNIPARYVSAYGPGVDPPDFHAVAEVWLGGGWHLVDATGMSAPDELVVIGVGRDACDAPFMETEEEATLLELSIAVSRCAPGGRIGPADQR